MSLNPFSTALTANARGAELIAQTEARASQDERLTVAIDEYSKVTSADVATINAQRLIDAIDNLDLPYLVDMLHSGNVVTRRLFTRFTTLTLPGNRDLQSALEAWTGKLMPLPEARAERVKAAPVSTGSGALDAFLEPMSALQRGQASKFLLSKVRYDGEVMTQAQLVETLAARGYQPDYYYTQTGKLMPSAQLDSGSVDLEITALRLLESITGCEAEQPRPPALLLSTALEERRWQSGALRRGDRKTIGGHSYFFDGSNWCLTDGA